MERDVRWPGQKRASRLNERLDVRLLHVRPQKCGLIRPPLNERDRLWRVESLQDFYALACRFCGQDCGDKGANRRQCVLSPAGLSDVTNHDDDRHWKSS